MEGHLAKNQSPSLSGTA